MVNIIPILMKIYGKPADNIMIINIFAKAITSFESILSEVFPISNRVYLSSIIGLVFSIQLIN